MDDSVRLVRELARIARENELAEIEYRSGKSRLRLILETPAPTVSQASQVVYAQHPAQPPPVVTTPEPEGPKITTPLAGVFYRAPRPGAPPFVEVGQQVSTGQTLCIIEAMKLMNEITAEAPCRVERILVENGVVVEPGQPLFAITPLG